MHVSFIGPQGSGKSTQLKMLATMGYHPFVMSDILTAAQASDPEFAKTSALCMVRGELVPTPVTFPKYVEAIAPKIQDQLNIAIDGMPRDLEQVQLQHGHLRLHDYDSMYLLFVLHPENETAIEIAKYRIAKRVKEMLANGEQPRADDLDPVKVHKRLTTYFSNLPGMLDYLSGTGAIVHQIDAYPAPDKVSMQIKACLHTNEEAKQVA